MPMTRSLVVVMPGGDATREPRGVGRLRADEWRTSRVPRCLGRRICAEGGVHRVREACVVRSALRRRIGDVSWRLPLAVRPARGAARDGEGDSFTDRMSRPTRDPRARDQPRQALSGDSVRRTMRVRRENRRRGRHRNAPEVRRDPGHQRGCARHDPYGGKQHRGHCSAGTHHKPYAGSSQHRKRVHERLSSWREPAWGRSLQPARPPTVARVRRLRCLEPRGALQSLRSARLALHLWPPSASKSRPRQICDRKGCGAG